LSIKKNSFTLSLIFWPCIFENTPLCGVPENRDEEKAKLSVLDEFLDYEHCVCSH
jgi:hypothetical protein